MIKLLDPLIGMIYNAKEYCIYLNKAFKKSIWIFPMMALDPQQIKPCVLEAYYSRSLIFFRFSQMLL
jgi:hypothetical protein